MPTATSSVGLTIEHLTVRAAGREVVRDVSLAIQPGQVHALMGPNGSGKSSLAYAIAGHPDYEIQNGRIYLGSFDLAALTPEARAQVGLFLSFQEPPEIGGISTRTFLKVASAKSQVETPADFETAAAALGLAATFLDRFLNQGFSGGEKKKSEILQFLARRPKVAILDEVDTGLDHDASAVMAKVFSAAAAQGAALLFISHAPALFERLEPQRIHVMRDGRIVASGGKEVLTAILQSGYSSFL